jgi:hypothetical protein
MYSISHVDAPWTRSKILCCHGRLNGTVLRPVKSAYHPPTKILLQQGLLQIVCQLSLSILFIRSLQLRSLGDQADETATYLLTCFFCFCRLVFATSACRRRLTPLTWSRQSVAHPATLPRPCKPHSPHKRESRWPGRVRRKSSSSFLPLRQYPWRPRPP